MADLRVKDYVDEITTEDGKVYIHVDKTGFSDAKKVLVETIKNWFKVGDQQYTEENYVTDDETLTASIDALDMQVKDNADRISASSTNLYKVSIKISPSEIRSLNSIPVEIIAAQGSYIGIDILSAVAENVVAGTPYDALTNKLILRYDGESTGLYEWSNSFIESSSRVMHKGVISSNVVMKTNKKVELYVESADPTAGDGSFFIYILYRLITTPSSGT